MDRDAKIKALAQWIWDQEENGFPVDAAEIERRNARGWAFVGREGGVVLTPDELREAQARVAVLRRSTDEHS